MGRHHIAAARRSAHLQVVGILDRHPLQQEDLSRATGLPASDDLESLVESTRPEGAIVATPDATHVELADACRILGLHALVEKPLCTNPAEATALGRRFAASDLVLAAGLVERFNPAWNALHGLRSRLGPIRSIRIVRESGPPRHRDSGVAFDLAVHDLDLLLRWSGSDSVLRVHSRISTPTRLEARLELDGAVVDLVASWESLVPIRTWTVHGSNGVFAADLGSRALTWTPAESTHRDEPLPDHDPLELEQASFAKAIRDRSAAEWQAQLDTHLASLELCQILS